VGCSVQRWLGDPDGQVFVATTPASRPDTVVSALLGQAGVLNAELDPQGNIAQATLPSIPSALYDKTPVNYFGTSVWEGYVNQPAAQIINLARAQSSFNVSGDGIVAVIDTGVDSTHPVLQGVLLPGHDFTRNQSGADEKADLQQSSAAVIDGVPPVFVSQSSAAVIDQSSAAVIDTPQYAAFGHGTMVAGVIHLVAPTALILPLKAFNADGTGYASDVIHAIHWAVRHKAKILNMSFSFSSRSSELIAALSYANKKGLVAFAAAGNDGTNAPVYPAADSADVMGVASTANNDVRSVFSNYGSPDVYVAAPGEGIVTLYPFGTYAAGSGTSFSDPQASGWGGLCYDVNPVLNQSNAAPAIAQAQPVSPDLGNGRIDLYRAVGAYLAAVGPK
jgi:hypothetical protein